MVQVNHVELWEGKILVVPQRAVCLARSWALRFGVLAGMHVVEIPVPEMSMMTSPTLRRQWEDKAGGH